MKHKILIAFIYLFFANAFACNSQISETLESRYDTTNGFYKINDPFYEINLATLIELNLKDYSNIYYESLPIKKNKIIKMKFVYGFMWKHNQKKNVIIEYKLKNDEHLTNIYKIGRPEFTDTTYYIQDIYGELHIIEDTLNLNTKTDSINQYEKKRRADEPIKLQTFDNQNRLIQYRIRDNLVKFEYDNNNLLVKERRYVVVKQNKDSVEKIYDEIRYEYINGKLSKIKHYSESLYPNLADGLYQIEEYKYSSQNNPYKGTFDPPMKSVDVLTTRLHEITEKQKTKIKYTHIVGIKKIKTKISWTNYNRTTVITDYLNEPRIKKSFEIFTKE